MIHIHLKELAAERATPPYARSQGTEELILSLIAEVKSLKELIERQSAQHASAVPSAPQGAAASGVPPSGSAAQNPLAGTVANPADNAQEIIQAASVAASAVANTYSVLRRIFR